MTNQNQETFTLEQNHINGERVFCYSQSAFGAGSKIWGTVKQCKLNKWVMLDKEFHHYQTKVRYDRAIWSTEAQVKAENDFIVMKRKEDQIIQENIANENEQKRQANIKKYEIKTPVIGEKVRVIGRGDFMIIYTVTSIEKANVFGIEDGVYGEVQIGTIETVFYSVEEKQEVKVTEIVEVQETEVKPENSFKVGVKYAEQRTGKMFECTYRKGNQIELKSEGGSASFYISFNIEGEFVASPTNQIIAACDLFIEQETQSPEKVKGAELDCIERHDLFVKEVKALVKDFVKVEKLPYAYIGRLEGKMYDGECYCTVNYSEEVVNKRKQFIIEKIEYGVTSDELKDLLNTYSFELCKALRVELMEFHANYDNQVQKVKEAPKTVEIIVDELIESDLAIYTCFHLLESILPSLDAFALNNLVYDRHEDKGGKITPNELTQETFNEFIKGIDLDPVSLFKVVWQVLEHFNYHSFLSALSSFDDKKTIYSISNKVIKLDDVLKVTESSEPLPVFKVDSYYGNEDGIAPFKVQAIKDGYLCVVYQDSSEDNWKIRQSDKGEYINELMLGTVYASDIVTSKEKKEYIEKVIAKRGYIPKAIKTTELATA